MGSYGKTSRETAGDDVCYPWASGNDFILVGISGNSGTGVSIVIGKIRPQIMAAIIAALIFSMFGAWIGYLMGATEVLTGLIGALFGFLAGTAMKILENE